MLIANLPKICKLRLNLNCNFQCIRLEIELNNCTRIFEKLFKILSSLLLFS